MNNENETNSRHDNSTCVDHFEGHGEGGDGDSNGSHGDRFGSDGSGEWSMVMPSWHGVHINQITSM